MKIDRAEIHHICIPMHKPFVTGCGIIKERHILIIKLFADGLEGLGECCPNYEPFYSPESIPTCKSMIKDFLLPLILKREFYSVDDLVKGMSGVVGNHMAKSSLELAFWDILSREQGKPICEMIGGNKKTVDAGVSVGIFKTLEETLKEINFQLNKGFRRLKMKIKPGHDYSLIKFLRKRIGDFPLMADANSSYTLDLSEDLKALDEFNLTQIEQPLAHDDIVDHAKLQRIINTSICLDESIVHLQSARQAIDLNSCRVINVKIARVGGLLEAKRIHDLCAEKKMNLWCGSMLESGIGMMYNIIFSSLPGVNQPGDIQESFHYMTDDIVEQPVTMSSAGTFEVPREPGIGVRVDKDKLSRYLINTEVVR
ncbi:MAG: o-succinylbenzoate synthase [Spirochaetes bacterium]|nr:o-succinylbenzoate synthase [Spirochaetota bacterium]